MANKALFGTAPGSYVPPADTTNEAGGKAYEYTTEQALAQYACTGTLNGSFYATAQQTLDKVKELCAGLDSDYIAAVALYARKNSFMKDMPALLLAILAGRCKNPKNPTEPGEEEVKAAYALTVAFPHVIDNGKMLRNFVQMVKSGVLGRKSMGAVPRRVVAQYLNRRHASALFRDSVGNNPTLADIIKLARPKAPDAPREAFFRYLIGKGDILKPELLPAVVRQYETFKQTLVGTMEGTYVGPVPDVDFRMLDSLPLSPGMWKEIAVNAKWHMTRMNLNTFQRHGVFDDPQMIAMVTRKLRDEASIKAARVFPYQLMMAFQAATDVPSEVRLALQDAMEIATQNVQPLGRGVVAVDVSGSMGGVVTGYGGKPSNVRYVDVAALIGAVLMRKEPQTIILPFDTSVYIPNKGTILNPRDSIMTLATQLARFGGGGTNCALPLQYLLEKKVTGLDYVLYASDGESWIDTTTPNYGFHHNGTAMLHLWERLKIANPNCKLICINIAVTGSSQAPTRRDILNVGGFSDDVFRVAEGFVTGKNPDYWVQEIKKNWDLLVAGSLTD